MRRRTLTTEYRCGFTLIELLVVIAIIAILAAILFPVFARAQAKARQNSCLSNLRQINMALITYCTDHDGYGPYTWWPIIDGHEVEQPWSCKLGEYGAPYYVYDPTSTDLTTAGMPYSVNPLWLCTSGPVTSSYDIPYYRGGYYCDWRANCPSNLLPWSLQQYDKVAAQTILVGEAQMTLKPGYYQGVYGSRGWDTSFASPKYPWPQRNQPLWPGGFSPSGKAYHPEWAAHNGGMNEGFFDGHVKWISQLQFGADFFRLWSGNGVWYTNGTWPEIP